MTPRLSLDPTRLRRTVVEMAYRGRSVHVPCAFSLIELLATLYSRHLRYNPADARDPERDLLVLSKGHGVMALYACFLEIGWLKQPDIDSYFGEGSLLHGLGERKIPGLEANAGSLGHGLPVATGMALGLKRLESDRRVYCILSDGELNEGTTWEALLFAAHHSLSNLTLIVDANGFQAMGRTSDVLNTEPLGDKLRSFGFDTRECDGHDMPALDDILTSQKTATRPSAIIARTIKGKGISFMESDNTWHYTRLNEQSYDACLRELADA